MWMEGWWMVHTTVLHNMQPHSSSKSSSVKYCDAKDTAACYFKEIVHHLKLVQLAANTIVPYMQTAPMASNTQHC
jgi:hypothetical protein